jgi:hypothetical protein
MSFFGTILDKLGLGAANARPSPELQAAPAPAGPIPESPAAPAQTVPQPHTPLATSAVDVLAKLEGLAAANPQKLNWKTSIVDLLKLLGLDSSLGARRQLATELGCPTELMGDSARMNTWLHKTVLRRLAENGGNIPKDLLD